MRKIHRVLGRTWEIDKGGKVITLYVFVPITDILDIISASKGV